MYTIRFKFDFSFYPRIFLPCVSMVTVRITSARATSVTFAADFRLSVHRAALCCVGVVVDCRLFLSRILKKLARFDFRFQRWVRIYNYHYMCIFSFRVYFLQTSHGNRDTAHVACSMRGRIDFLLFRHSCVVVRFSISRIRNTRENGR